MMRPALRLSAFLILSLPLLAQDAPSPSPAPPTPPAAAPAPAPTGSITGSVYCADTHLPARGAMVIVVNVPTAEGKHSRNANASASAMNRTALDGTYLLGHLDPGEYSVIAFLPGYLNPLGELDPEDFDNNPGPKVRERLEQYGTVTIDAGGSAKFDISLERGAAISGTVLYSDGSPATQVILRLEDTHAKPSPKSGNGADFDSFISSFITRQNLSTDDRGRFRKSGLKPGSYRVAAIQPAMSASSTDRNPEMMAELMGLQDDPAALRIYAGDTLHKNSAKVYDLRPGDEVTGVDITIPISIFHQVHGILSAKDGRAINSASITLTDTTDDSFTFKSSVGDDGSFAFSTVPAGTYKLSATAATITVLATVASNGMPFRFAPRQTTNAFADNSTTLVVKDADLDDITLTLDEVPLPPPPAQPKPGDPDEN